MKIFKLQKQAIIINREQQSLLKGGTDPISENTNTGYIITGDTDVF